MIGNNLVYKFWKAFGRLDEEVLEQLKETDNILDIGGGTKPNKEANVIMDISRSSRKVIVHDANIIKYPFQKDYFDKVHFSHTLEHLDSNTEIILEEVYRILKCYGKLYLTVPNALFIYHRVLYFFGIIPCNFVLCHKKHFSFSYLKTALRNSGFKIYELENLWLFNPFRNFTNKHIRIVAKKIG